MAEISVSILLVEKEDSTYSANCPDLGVTAEGKNGDEALKNLKETIEKHIREKGNKVKLYGVKCLRLKVNIPA